MAEQQAAADRVSSQQGWSAYPSDVLAWLGRLGLSRNDRRHASQEELLVVLHDVADAVSSAIDVEQVLDLIVESAKRITGSDKAIIALVDEDGGGIDPETFVVRGRRDQHEQTWWERRLQQIGRPPYIQPEPVLEPHPREQAWLMCCPVLVKGAPVGFLCTVNESVRPFTQLQQDSLSILSTFAASSIESARMAEQARHVYMAGERDRIAREMHDGVVQSLFSISLGMEVCKKQIHRDPEAVALRLDELQLHLNSAMTELRRFIYDLRPVKLAELGLVGALEFWVSEITMGRAIRGYVTVKGSLPRLSPSEEAVFYRVAKESVSNAVRHSGARSVTVTIEPSADAVRLTIADDGDGFDVDRALTSGAAGIGLDSIRQRVSRDGGRISIQSQPGAGTRVVMHLPVGEAV